VKKINFILGVHNHQPVGNFDHVFEEAYKKAYLPLLETLEQHPKIRMMYHTTGPLLDWLEDHYPEFLDRVKNLVDYDQLEIMTGGYYEPILAVLPDRDKIGQIRMMTEYEKKRFGADPKGLWMAERIWEPHLAKPLFEAGVKFVTLDDYHFHAAGVNPDELRGYYLTDEQGCSVGVFPISMKLRYMIPFAKPEETVAYLQQNADDSGENLLLMCDDGEKFGLWPGTHEWVYTKGWLENFFIQLENAIEEGWLNMTTCSEFSVDFKARGRIYLPCASYFEMSEWSLPAESGAKFAQIYHRLEKEKQIDEIRPFFKGGFWRNFIAKYDESNFMYRKALWVSNRIQSLAGEISNKQKNASNQLAAARRALYAAQCNCAYWHGVFGGLYLPHLRHAVYQKLLEAEDICNQIETSGDGFTDVIARDFDADGNSEIMLRNERVGLLISPARGGSIYELDYIPARFNLLNSLARQPESYHQMVGKADNEIEEGSSIHDQVLSKEEGLDQYLIYDRHHRGAMLDHFLSTKESPESLQNGKYCELGDFINQPYIVEIRAVEKEKSITLRRIGDVVDNQIDLKKTVQLLENENGLAVKYRIVNVSNFPLTILFAPEFNFAMLAGDSPDRYYRDDNSLDRQPLRSRGISENVKEFSLINEADRFAVNFRFEQPTEVWRYPVETVSQSEGGFERVYQSSCVLPIYRLTIQHGKAFKIGFKLVIEPLE